MHRKSIAKALQKHFKSTAKAQHKHNKITTKALKKHHTRITNQAPWHQQSLTRIILHPAEQYQADARTVLLNHRYYVLVSQQHLPFPRRDLSWDGKFGDSKAQLEEQKLERLRKAAAAACKIAFHLSFNRSAKLCNREDYYIGREKSKNIALSIDCLPRLETWLDHIRAAWSASTPRGNPKETTSSPPKSCGGPAWGCRSWPSWGEGCT
jgi:hypothetical protein